MENTTEKTPAGPLYSGDLFGVLTRVGTFTVGPQNITGFLVECTEEMLREVKYLPMYSAVVILTEAEHQKLLNDLAHWRVVARYNQATSLPNNPQNSSDEPMRSPKDGSTAD